MADRLCGPHCPTPDAPHRDPEPDWIGNMPIYHGESDHPVPDTGGWNGLYTESPEMFCLCGHPNYLMCPIFWDGGGIGGVSVGVDQDGAVAVADEPTFQAGGDHQ